MSGSNFTQTPNLKLYKPTFNADVGAWGGHWNSNADTLDSVISGLNAAAGNYLPLAGGTMTGLLTLSGPPTANLHAATKQYVDTSLPVGGPFLSLSGGTVTGATTYSAAATALTVTNNARINGTLTMAGTLAILGTAAGTATTLQLQAAAGQARKIYTYSGNAARWTYGVDNIAESGNNAGSAWTLYSFNDAGTFNGAIINAVRGTGPTGQGNPYIANLAGFDITAPRATTPGGVTVTNMSPPNVDVQPTTTLGTDPLSTTSGSPVVTVTWTGCGSSTGVFATGLGECWVNLLGATATGGITPTGWLRGTRVDANHFSITWTSNATSTTTGGGTAVTVRPNFGSIQHKRTGTSTTGTSGFPMQDMRLFVCDPAFYKASNGPQFQQEFRQVYGPSDPSGNNAWGVVATELDLFNRGTDTGYMPNLFAAKNATIGFWLGAFDAIDPGIAPSGGTARHWNTVFGIFGNGAVANYVGYSVQPNALVGAARDTATAHGGVAFMAHGSYQMIGAGGIATTNGSAVVTITSLMTTSAMSLQSNGMSVWIPTVQTVNGVTFGGSSYVMSNVTANTFSITGTGNATVTGTGGALQWMAFASLVPYAPAEFQGSFKHGISTKDFRSEDGSIIYTQPGNGLLWNDGTGTASINSTAISAGNLNVLLSPAGAGAVVAVGPLTIGSPTGPNIRAGTGAASGTQPSGSIWIRTDGSVGARLYVSAGAGTWAAVAGV